MITKISRKKKTNSDKVCSLKMVSLTRSSIEALEGNTVICFYKPSLVGVQTPTGYKTFDIIPV